MYEKEYSRISLLVKVAQLYYELGENQNKIADECGVSRSYVSKLLLEAKERGIVKFKIKDPMNTESELERTIRQRYNLRKVIVVSTRLQDNATNEVAKKAAIWINSIIKSGDIIAMGWGRTMYMFSQHLYRRNDLSDIKTVSISGQQSVVRNNIFATEGLLAAAKAWNAVGYVLNAPLFLSSPEMKELFLQEETISTVMDYSCRANIAIFTIGMPKRNSYLNQPNGPSSEDVQALISKGAVADIVGHLIDKDGNLTDPKLDSRMVVLPLDELKRKDYKVAIVSDRTKVDATLTAMELGYINVLVTDEDVARQICMRI